MWTDNEKAFLFLYGVVTLQETINFTKFIFFPLGGREEDSNSTNSEESSDVKPIMMMNSNRILRQTKVCMGQKWDFFL